MRKIPINGDKFAKCGTRYRWAILRMWRVNWNTNKSSSRSSLDTSTKIFITLVCGILMPNHSSSGGATTPSSSTSLNFANFRCVAFWSRYFQHPKVFNGYGLPAAYYQHVVLRQPHLKLLCTQVTPHTRASIGSPMLQVSKMSVQSVCFTSSINGGCWVFLDVLFLLIKCSHFTEN